MGLLMHPIPIENVFQLVVASSDLRLSVRRELWLDHSGLWSLAVL